MILEEVNILWHLIDLSLDLLELRLKGLEVTLEMEDLLGTLFLFIL